MRRNENLYRKHHCSIRSGTEFGNVQISTSISPRMAQRLQGIEYDVSPERMFEKKYKLKAHHMREEL